MSLSKPVNLEDLMTFGFLCEFNDEVCKVYTLEHGLLEMPNTDCVELVLGTWYNICDGELDRYNIGIKDCKTWEENGEVMVEVLAIAPNDWCLPKKISDKYSMKVWSPILKFLVDEEDIFNSEYNGGDVGKVVVKFAPHPDGRNFEVVRIPNDPHRVVTTGIAYVNMTPWTLEYMAEHMQPVHEYWPAAPIINQYKKLPQKKMQALGVCIKTNVFNPTHKASNVKGGSTDEICILFSPKYGLTRWSVKSMQAITHNHDAEVRAAKELQTEKLGNWFAYELVDKRQDGKKNHRPESNDFKGTIYYNCAARNVTQVEPVKATKIVDGEVEFDASFAYKRSMLEDENAQMRKDAHFFDVDLGRVEIYPEFSKFLIKKIKNHQEMLREQHPAEYSRLESELIVVAVKVRVHNKYYENSKKYPDHGIFKVLEATRIFYMNGGHLIFDADLKEKK